MTIKLTKAEHQAICAAFKSANDNGHDFGFVEDVVRALRPMKAQAVGALISNLAKKGIFTVHEPVVTNDGGRDNTYTQFTWNRAVSDIQHAVFRGEVPDQPIADELANAIKGILSMYHIHGGTDPEVRPELKAAIKAIKRYEEQS